MLYVYVLKISTKMHANIYLEMVVSTSKHTATCSKSHRTTDLCKVQKSRHKISLFIELNSLEMVKVGEYSDTPTKRLMTNPPPILPFYL
jgi:hypothetical protein